MEQNRAQCSKLKCIGNCNRVLWLNCSTCQYSITTKSTDLAASGGCYKSIVAAAASGPARQNTTDPDHADPSKSSLEDFILIPQPEAKKLTLGEREN